MALGEFTLFNFKSKKQREKEEREYAAWAFPNGELQRERLAGLMRELKPRESPQLMMFSFLTCKELYKNQFEEAKSHEDAISRFLGSAKNYKQLIRRDDLCMYLALVLADADIDEKCEYPGADEIRTRASELEELRKSK